MTNKQQGGTVIVTVKIHLKTLASERKNRRRDSPTENKLKTLVRDRERERRVLKSIECAKKCCQDR